MKNKKPRFPIREYLGKFEAWILVMKGRSAFRNYDRVLERLFEMFPGKTCCSQFTSIDIADYKAIRQKKGIQEYSLWHELRMIRNFWKYLQEDCGLAVANPVRALQNRPGGHDYAKGITLDEVNKLLAECSVKDQRAILQVIQGGKLPRKRDRQGINEAVVRAGLKDFDLYKLKLRISNGLSRDIVVDYCSRLLKDIDQPANPVASESSIDLRTASL